MIRNRLRVDRGEREWENFKQSEKYISKISRFSRNGMHQVNSRSGIKGTGHHPVLPRTVSNGKIPIRSDSIRCRREFRNFPKVLIGQTHGLVNCLKWQSTCSPSGSLLIFSIWMIRTGLQ